MYQQSSIEIKRFTRDYSSEFSQLYSENYYFKPEKAIS